MVFNLNVYLVFQWGIYFLTIMGGGVNLIMRTIFKKNSRRTNNNDKQITSVNPEKLEEKDDFLVLCM